MYNDPTFTAVREWAVGENPAGSAYSVPSSASMYKAAEHTSQFRSAQRCVVLGVTVIGASGGSVGGTVSLKIARLIAGGAESLMTGKSINASKTTSFLGNVEQILCTQNPITLESFGDCVYLVAESSTLADKCANLTNICWRYRLLPSAAADPTLDGL